MDDVSDAPVLAAPPGAYTAQLYGRVPAEHAADIFGAIIALAADAVISLDEEQRIALFNPAAERIFGYAAREVVGQPLDLLLPEQHAARHRAEHVPAFGASPAAARRMGERREVRGRRRSGEEFPAEVAISKAVVDGRMWYHAVVRDVTERTRREEALRASEARFRGIFDSTFHFIGLLAPDGTLLEANRAALDFAGVTTEEVIGRPFWETPWWTHSGEAQAGLRDAVARAAAGAFVRFESEHRAPDGRAVVVDFSLKPVRDGAGRVTLLVPEGNDVTEARRMAALLRESEETFRSAFEYSGIGMSLNGLDGRWLRVNRAMCGMFGYDEAELLARTFQEITHPDDLGDNLELVRQTLAGERSWFETEKRYLHRDGRVVWARINVSLVRDAAGAPRFFVSQVQDVTARRAAHEALERHYAEARRAAAVRDEVLGVVSHDLRSPLSTISMAAGELRGEADADVAKLGEMIGRSATWALHIIRDLLDVTAIEAGRLAIHPEPMTVAAILESTEAMFAELARERAIALTFDREPAAQWVEADVDRLVQALGNLVGNAIKFTPRGGSVSVSVTTDGGSVRFRVADTGPGIAPEDLPRLFDRFWQAHRTRRGGAGLGLAIVEGIVEGHGGRVEVESTVGAGSAFTLVLPAAGSLARVGPATQGSPRVRGA